MSVGEGAAERVTVTTDDATLLAVEGIAAILHAHGCHFVRLFDVIFGS